MADKSIALITGGNTGIGYETVKALYASPEAHTILMGSRSLDKANAAISTLKSEFPDSKSEIVPIQIDIEDDASIEAAFKEVSSKHTHIDTLINNAGASFDLLMRTSSTPSTIRSAWNKSYTLNVTSTQVFTHTFIPLLLASTSPRLLFITSGLSSLAGAASGSNAKTIASAPPAGWPKPFTPSHIAYRSSKVALNMLMLDWVRMLEPDGVKVFAISPGFLATGLGGMGSEMLRKFGAGEPSVGGEFIADVVRGERDGDAGKVVSKDGVQPW
ncbi:NAD(P)-binding protein [Ophiobolus disseminans]|uniref:NAD(P)-binding protein n=1 Tax=Ophiobolus disseminans TaxID=1469910 RepID=A0A6A6ZTH9_9PLEO|nr:NAD(P)-binding protein [Ophiobolus disseminans]